ncbi:MAG: hypothetical protein ACUZ8E_15805 [Candidatus Anammoxibacter sp.]
MKQLLTLFAIIITLTASAQIDSFIYNAPNGANDTLIAYRIDTAVTGGSQDSNMVWVSYHYIQTTGDSFLYQPQFIMYDSANVQILPNVDLMNAGWRASGTVKQWYIDSAMAAQTPDSLRTFYVLPELESIFTNVTKL